MKILIVDDAPSILDLMEAYLYEFGYTEVLTAKSAHEAFGKLEADAKSQEDSKIDLVLLDVNMPGTDGIDACRRIKTDAKSQAIPVIMVTGVDDTEHLRHAFYAGAMDYVTKPVNKLELQVRVRSALALKRAMDDQKSANADLEQRNEELQLAWNNVKILQGLISICATCKKIRNDSGDWNLMEAYIADHSEANFSHGICPDCQKEEYPEIYERLKARSHTHPNG